MTPAAMYFIPHSIRLAAVAIGAVAVLIAIAIREIRK